MPPKDIESNACLVDENGDVIPLESLLNQLVSNLVNNNNIGTKNDFVKVPYTFGINSVLAHSNTLYYHMHGQPFVYPNHEDNVVLTSAAGIWNQGGALIEVIPSGVLNISAFDLHWMNISDISANSQIQIDIYSGEPGSEIWIGATRTHRNAVQAQEGAKRIQIPQQSKGNRISCRLSDNTAGVITCAVSFEGHYYFG